MYYYTYGLGPRFGTVAWASEIKLRILIFMFYFATGQHMHGYIMANMMSGLDWLPHGTMRDRS